MLDGAYGGDTSNKRQCLCWFSERSTHTHTTCHRTTDLFNTNTYIWCQQVCRNFRGRGGKNAYSGAFEMSPSEVGATRGEESCGHITIAEEGTSSRKRSHISRTTALHQKNVEETSLPQLFYLFVGSESFQNLKRVYVPNEPIFEAFLATSSQRLQTN